MNKIEEAADSIVSIQMPDDDEDCDENHDALDAGDKQILQVLEDLAASDGDTSDSASK